ETCRAPLSQRPAQLESHSRTTQLLSLLVLTRNFLLNQEASFWREAAGGGHGEEQSICGCFAINVYYQLFTHLFDLRNPTFSFSSLKFISHSLQSGQQIQIDHVLAG